MSRPDLAWWLCRFRNGARRVLAGQGVL